MAAAGPGQPRQDPRFCFAAFAGGKPGFSPAAWLILAAFAASHAIVFRFFPGDRLAALPDLVFYAAIGVWVALMLPFIPTDVTPFIYFQF